MHLQTPHKLWLTLPLLALALTAVGCGRPGVLAQSEGSKVPGPVTPAGSNSVPMFGGTPSRNMVNLVEKNVPSKFSVKKGAFENIKWEARLGSHAYGGPVIAGGRIFVSTNNASPRDPAITEDKGIVLCFRESDGKFLWQAVHDKLDDAAQDNGEQGIASTPCVDGDRLYYVSNRAEVVCADVAGDEKSGKAKFLWTFDMIGKLGVYPSQLANCSPLVLGDAVFVCTSNGVNAESGKLPAPKAPSFIALNKKTGEVIWQSSLPGTRIIRGQWSNPAAATIGGRTQVIFGGGDGWLYSLDAKDGELIWKFDCNPKKAKPYKPSGGGERCFIVGTPVIHDKKCYVAVGQEPDDGSGVGHLWCIDVTKKPANKEKDLSPVGDNFDPKAPVNKDSGLVWHVGGKIDDPKGDRQNYFEKTISTVAIVDGLLYATELAGYLNCFDAKTGEKFWEYDFQETIWCSPYYVDGKVFVGTNGGDLYVFRPGKKLEKLNKIQVGGQLLLPPVACNGVLYVNTGKTLYAVGK
jgi:outer membrane protein assembly factor BamB